LRFVVKYLDPPLCRVKSVAQLTCVHEAVVVDDLPSDLLPCGAVCSDHVLQ
jgi:hypothetical protein